MSWYQGLHLRTDGVIGDCDVFFNTLAVEVKRWQGDGVPETLATDWTQTTLDELVLKMTDVGMTGRCVTTTLHVSKFPLGDPVTTRVVGWDEESESQIV